jgi:hypothetical protein
MVQAALTPVDGQTAIGVTRTGTPVPAFGGPEVSVAEVDCQNDRRVSGAPQITGGPDP